MFENISADIKRLESKIDHNIAWKQFLKQTSFRELLSFLLSLEFQAVASYRIARFCKKWKIPFAGFMVLRVSEIMTGVAIPALADIGPGLKIFHFGNIVIHSGTIIGNHCNLDHGVTIGERDNSGEIPRIGNNVLIGTHATILGGITIGDNCRIGAHAVVVKSIPSNCTVVGNSAKIIKRNLPYKPL